MNRIFPLRTHKKSISRHTASEQKETLEIMQEKKWIPLFNNISFKANKIK